MLSKLLPNAIVILLGLFLAPLTAGAATVSMSNDGACRVEISGEIRRGDFDQLKAIAEYLVIHDGESTSRSVLCLDSPGGNVVDGLLMAEFILEKGVSTRIQENAQCYSICAIMFMMGNYKGGEVAGLSRTMHVTAQLGFHRPYLSLDEAGVFTAGDIEATYEIGVATIYDIMTLATHREPWGTAQMIEPDLLRRITGTPGSELFVVSTVEEALRWRIEVQGIQPPTNVGRAHLLFACENALAQQVSLTTELAGDGMATRIVFDLEPLQSYSIREAVDGPRWDSTKGRYSVTSLRAGYVGVGCEVDPTASAPAVCGRDEATDTTVGDCNDEYGMRGLPPIAYYHPSTQLRALPFIAGNAPDAAAVRRCRIFDANQSMTDDQSCLQEVVLYSEVDKQFSRHYLSWPSGSRTVIEIGVEGYQISPYFRINGQAAIPQNGPDGASCLTNLMSGNTICLSS